MKQLDITKNHDPTTLDDDKNKMLSHFDDHVSVSAFKLTPANNIEKIKPRILISQQRILDIVSHMYILYTSHSYHRKVQTSTDLVTPRAELQAGDNKSAKYKYGEETILLRHLAISITEYPFCQVTSIKYTEVHTITD